MLHFNPQFPDKNNDWQNYFRDRAANCKHRLLTNYFAAGCLDPDTRIGDAPLMAMDMETTGLDANHDDIVSIGLIPFDLKRIRISERFYQVFKPVKPLTDASVTFHRITHEQIHQAPDLNDKLEELIQAMTGKLVVVHYREIERPFLDQAVQNRLGDGMRFPMIDTMSIEAQRHRFSRWAKFRRWLGYPPVSIRLYDSRQRYHLPIYQGHHALTDALATAELFQAQVARHFSSDTPVKALWS